MSSPFRPKVGHVDSVENFDKLWTDMAPEDSPCNTPPAADLNTFQVLQSKSCLLARIYDVPWLVSDIWSNNHASRGAVCVAWLLMQVVLNAHLDRLAHTPDTPIRA